MKSIRKNLSLVLTIAMLALFPTYSSFAQNNALSFDGSGDYISIPNNDQWDFGYEEFTISFWMTLADLNKVHDGLFGRDDFQWIAMEYNHDSDKRLNLWMDSNGASSWNLNNLKPGKNDWVADTWYHIAIVRRDNTIYIYIDGELGASSGYSQTVYNPSVPIYFGRSQLAARNHTGLLDNIRIWNYGLSQEDIQASMNIELSGTEPGLIGYWDLNESSGAVAYDSSPTEVNASLNGDAVFVVSDSPVSGPSVAPFDPVAPTGLPYNIIISDVTIEGGALPVNAQIGIYDGALCVGAAIYDGTENLQIISWEKDDSQSLPGFTYGNNISVKVRTPWYSVMETFDANTTFIQGDGTFGNDIYSVIALSVTTSLEPDIDVSDNVMNFNAISIDSSKTMELIVYNNGNTNLDITSITSNSGDFIVTPGSMYLENGEQDTIQVTFDPSVVNDYVNILSIVSDDPDEGTVEVELHGTSLPSATPAMTVEPLALDFEGIQQNTTKTLSFNILNTGNGDLNVTNITSSGSAFIINGPVSFTLSQGENNDVHVYFSPTSPGIYNETITINSNDGNKTVYLSGVASDGHFTPVEPTGLPYNIIVQNINIDEFGVEVGDEIAVYDDELCVGIEVVDANYESKGALFDGNGDYVLIPNSDIFDISYLTIEAWIYSSNYNQNMFIFEKGPVNTQYSLFFEGSNICFRTYPTSGGYDSYYVNSSSIGITGGAWHHVAATYDGQMKRIYVDGEERVSQSYTKTLRTGQQGQIIGAYGGTGSHSYYWNGTIDEVRVWNYARTETQIQSAMYEAFTIIPDGLIGYWNFDDGTANDLSDNANHGTFYGNATITDDGAALNPKNIQLVAWKKDDSQGLPGFTQGNPMSFKIWTNVYYEDVELDATAEYITGDGTFGYGQYSVVNLSAESQLDPDIDLSTDYIYVGQLEVNQSVNDTLIIYNNGNALLEVNLAENSSQFSINTLNANIVENDSLIVIVSFSPTSAGNHTTVLSVNSNDPDEPLLEVTLEGFALPVGVPDIDLSTNALNFNGVVINTPKTLSFNVINIGTAELDVTNITSDNGQFTITPTNFTLQNTNDNQQVQVTFIPTGKGEKTATVTVTSNGGNRTLSLNGVGYDGHFQSVEQTGILYNIIVESTNLNEYLEVGDEIAVYDDTLCVGTSPVLPHGRSLSLDGNGDYMTLEANDNYYLGTDDFTIELWAYLRSGVSYQHFLAMNDQNTFGFKADNTNKIVYFYSSSYSTYGDINATYNYDEWTHISLVRNGNIAYIYINGELAGTKSGFNNIFPENVLKIGNGIGSEYTDGYLDDIRIWNVARTQSEIQDNMYIELTGNESGLIGYWKFNETVKDYSVTDNNNYTLAGNANINGPQYFLLYPVVQVVAWQADAGNNLPGFTPGNPIDFKIWSEINDIPSEFDASPTFIMGDGTFGYGQYSVVTLDFTVPGIEVSPDDFFVALDEPDSTQEIMTITNTGTDDLIFDINVQYKGTQMGNSASFDGNGDYIATGNWSPGTHWSVEAWVNPSSTPSGRRTIFGGFGSYVDWGITMSSGNFGTGIRTPTGGATTVTSGVIAETGVWYHITGTCDGTTAKIYVNGEYKNSAPTATNYNPYTGTRMGGEVCCSGNDFPGLIDEVRVWNYALSEEEIQENMHNPLNGNEPGLVAYWNFDDGTANDVTPNAHNGTLNGNTTVPVGSAPVADWLELSSYEDTLTSLEQLEDTLTFRSEGLLDGLYEADLYINNNAPNSSPVIVHVAMNVTGSAEVTVSADTLDFGEVIVGEGDTLTYTVENIGTNVLNVDTIYVKNDITLGYATIDNPVFPYTIDPVNSDDFSVSFIPDSDGEKTDSLLIINDSWNEDTVIIILKGTGLTPPDIAVSTDTWDDTMNSGEVLVDTFYVYNEGQALLEFTINENITWLSVEPSSGSIPVEDSVAISMNVSTIGIYAGVYNETINILSNDYDEPDIPFNLSLTVLGEPEIFSDGSVNFGNVNVNSSADHILIISNIGTDTLFIDSVKIAEPVFTFNTPPDYILPGEDDSIELTFSPVDPVVYNSILYIWSDAVTSPELTVVLQGTGIEPQNISVSPDSFNKIIASGNSNSELLTITNTGGQDLNYTITLEPLGKTALSLDGAGDYINILNSATLNPDTAVTIEAWVYLNQSSNEYIVAKEYSSMGTYRLFVNGSGKYQFMLNTNRSVISVSDANTDTWEHVAASFDGTTMRLYINGLPDAEQVFDEFTVNSNTANLRIGRSFANEYLDGKVDELRIWDTERNIYEIQAMKDQSLTGNEAGLVLYYKFNETGGNITIDSSPAGNSGTLYGNATRTTSLAPVDNFLSVSPSIGVVEPGNTQNVQVIFNAVGIRTNQFIQTLTINSNDLDEPEILIPVTMNVTGQPSVAVDPDTLFFDDTYFGFTDTATLTIFNNGGDDLTLTSLTIDNQEFSLIDNYNIVYALAAKEVDVLFDPSTPGSISGTLTVSSDDAINPDIDVELRGIGVEPPVIELSAASIDFDPVIVPFTDDSTLYVKNTGVSPLEVYSVVSSDPVIYSIDDDSPFTVISGDSTNIVITFAPDDFVDFNRTLTLATNIGDTIIPLTGAGIKAGKDIGITELVMPQTGCGLGDDDSVKVKIRNFGSAPQANFDVVYIVDEGTPVIENVGIMTVQPGENMIYTFSATVDVSVIGDYSFKTYTDLTDDETLTNDTLITVITNYPVLEMSASDDQSICDGSDITLIAAADESTFLWSTGSTNSYIEVSPSTTTSYTVTATNVNGCTATDTVTVTVIPLPDPPVITAGGSTTICVYDSVLLTSDIDHDILWSTGETTQSIYAYTEGIYTVTFTDTTSCSSTSAPVSVITETVPTISVLGQTTLCVGDTVDITVNNAVSYLWSTGETTKTISVSPEETETYSVVMTTNLGCVFSDSVTINVIPPVSPDPVSNMLPADGTLNLSKPINFSWAPGANSSSYDLYIWEESASPPSSPTVANITTINYTYSGSGLSYGLTYKWQIVSKNSCFETAGPIQSFTLRQLPDLIINSIQTPSTIYAGQPLTVTWETKNTGEGSTNSVQWADAVYLSLDTVLNTSIDILLGSKNNLSFLVPEQSYEQTQAFTIPESLIGNYFVLVKADNNNNLQETNEDNNYSFDASAATITVTIPPKPDLIVTSVGAPTSVFSGNTITVNYTVKNNGNANATGNHIYTWYFDNDPYQEHYWNDAIFISPSPTFSLSNSLLLENVYVGLRSSESPDVEDWYDTPDYLEEDSTYSRTIQATIPHYYSGTYYIFVMTDRNDYTDEMVENNNLLSSTPVVVTLSPPPDLIVTNITVPANAGSGEQVTVSWEVYNQGAVAPVENTWSDRVYYSQVDTFNTAYATSVGTVFKYNGSTLLPDSTYEKSLSFTLPNGISGQYYVYVHTDQANNVFEHTYDDNNISRSLIPINVDLSPYPDLIVTDIQLPDTIYADSSVNITWSVKNQGLITAAASWKDRIFISSDSLWNPGVAQGLVSIQHNSSLDTGQTYTENADVNLPSDIQGSKYIFVYTDIYDDVYEYNYENNNVASNAAFSVPDTSGGEPDDGGIIIEPDPTFADIAITAFTAPGTGNSGTTASMNWTVENISSDTTVNSYWYDYVFLSTDTIKDGSDISMGYKVHNGQLIPGQQYTTTHSFTIPNGYSGSYYLLLFVDYYGYNDDDTIPENNRTYGALEISLTPPPDLIVETFEIPENLIAGQQVQVPFTIKNDGVGITAQVPWYEKYYLSNTPTLSGSNYYLGNYKRDTALDAGNFYTDTITLTIPNYLSGFYYFIVRTDATNAVYEHDNEDNNLLNAIVQIEIPDPADLVVSSIDLPDDVFLGDDISVDYTIKNIGPNQAIGTLRDALYFSKDTAFDGVIDKLLGVNDRYLVIPPGDSTVSNITDRMPGVLPGGYRSIAKTNTLNTIIESDISNNQFVTEDSVMVSIKELFLGIPEVTPLDYGDYLYYKVNVDAGLDLLITLTSNQTNGSNEVYVAYDRVPAMNDFDYLFDSPSEVNQQVLIPSTQQGTYYIFVQTPINYYGLQDVTLLAEALPFSILSISPDTVGQGIVTCHVNGAGFIEDNTKFYILDPSYTVVDSAEMKNYLNSMQVEIRWDLTNVDIGTYHVKAKNLDGTADSLENGLTVEPSTGFMIDYSYVSPNILRVGHKGSYAFYYQNIGNVDIPYIKGDFTIPVSTDIVGLMTSGKIFKRSEFLSDTTLGTVNDWIDYDNYKHIPILGKDLAPGDLITVSLVVKGFYQGVFPVRVRALGYSTANFIQTQIALGEGLRQEMLNDPVLYGVDQHDDVLSTLNDPVAWRDSLLQGYFDHGILSPQDTAGVDLNCDDCINGYTGGASIGGYSGDFTYNPGVSPGVEDHVNAAFGPGQDYLWEINKYEGDAGADPGWDLVHATGTIDITSNNNNPFIVRIATLNYDNEPDYLAGWHPAVDKCWAIAVADGGFAGFSADKFVVDVTRFTEHNNLYGGTFSVMLQGTDTLLLCFTAYVPGVGEDGVPGAPGAPGEDGSPGGPGGPGDGAMPPGNGGPGGTGGPGTAELPPGNGGIGGTGGTGGPGQPGGTGGTGGIGGTGSPGGGPGGTGGPGGPGGDGGSGSPGGDGGTGGQGGQGGPGNGGGTGGTGGTGGSGGTGPGGTGNPGSPGSPGDTGEPTYSDEDDNPWEDESIPCSSDNLGQVFCDNFFRMAGCANSLIGCATNIATYTGAGAVIGAGFGAIAGAIWGGITCGIGIYNCATGGNDVTNAIGCIGIVDAMLCAGQYICNQVVKSCDPNDIIGPEGYGNPKFVSVNDLLPYTIRFENDSTFATTAAQRVEIRQQLDDDINPLSFRVGDFGFGEYYFEVPKGLSSYFVTIYFTPKGEPVPGADIYLEQDEDAYNADKLWALEFTAGVDINTNEAFWVLQTIDPLTGLPPTDPLMGFLAVNDTLGNGEGFVCYTVKPKLTSHTGDTIYAEAEIVFDINEPIMTPEIFNTIDALPPISSVTSLPEISDTLVPISVIGADDPGGSGVSHYEIYVSEDNTNFMLHDEVDYNDTLMFTGIEEHTYYFFSLGVDNVGNRGPMKYQGDTYTTINPTMTDSISGYLVYDNTANTPLENTKIYLIDTEGISDTDSVFTETDGYFLFEDVKASTYILEPSVTIPWGGGNATDALLVNRFAIGTYSFTEFREVAADVNLSATVNATDGLLIKRRSIGSITSFIAGDWVFSDDTIATAKDNYTQDIYALCVGDVNGSYVPSSKKQQANVFLISEEAKIIAESGLFEIPVKVTDNISPAAITLGLTFPGDLVNITDLYSKAEGLLYNIDKNTIRIAWDDYRTLDFINKEPLITLVAKRLFENDTSFVLGVDIESEFADADANVMNNIILSAPEIIYEKVTEIEEIELPLEYSLSNNCPNPFSKNTEISYTLPEEGNVRLEVFNLLGESIAVVVDNKQSAGRYRVLFERSDLAIGVYMYRLKVNGATGNFTKTKMMTISN